MSKLKITTEKDITIVNFLDVAFLDESSIKEIGEELENLIKDSNNINLIIDFKDVEYLSSAVLGKLVKIRKLIKGKGKIKLCGIKDKIMPVFKITKLDKMFEIYPDKKSALKSFKKGGFNLFGFIKKKKK